LKEILELLALVQKPVLNFASRFEEPAIRGQSLVARPATFVDALAALRMGLYLLELHLINVGCAYRRFSVI
jgi:hypothetical protein